MLLPERGTGWHVLFVCCVVFVRACRVVGQMMMLDESRRRITVVDLKSKGKTPPKEIQGPLKIKGSRGIECMALIWCTPLIARHSCATCVLCVAACVMCSSVSLQSEVDQVCLSAGGKHLVTHTHTHRKERMGPCGHLPVCVCSCVQITLERNAPAVNVWRASDGTWVSHQIHTTKHGAADVLWLCCCVVLCCVVYGVVGHVRSGSLRSAACGRQSNSQGGMSMHSQRYLPCTHPLCRS